MLGVGTQGYWEVGGVAEPWACWLVSCLPSYRSRWVTPACRLGMSLSGAPFLAHLATPRGEGLL